jgi:pantetheine-phosphate adenylyltransferase
MSATPRIAVFAGSFDPLTNGHLDLIDRSAQLADTVIVGVLRNPGKQPMFSLDDRIAMLREVLGLRPGVRVEAFQGLLVDFARLHDATIVIRGVRGASDFDYERQMAQTNRHLSPGLETVLLAPSPAVGHISATLVRQIASLGGSVRGLVPPVVESWIARQPGATRTV